MARILEVADTAPEELTDDEKRKVFWWYSYYGAVLEGWFIRWTKNQLDDEMWTGYERMMVGVLSRPVGQEWWASGMTPFTTSFRNHYEAKVAEINVDETWSLPKIG